MPPVRRSRRIERGVKREGNGKEEISDKRVRYSQDTASQHIKQEEEPTVCGQGDDKQSKTRKQNKGNAGRKKDASATYESYSDAKENASISTMGTAAALAAKTGGKRGLQTRLVPMNKFPYDLPYKQLDLRAEPYLYRPARGEQGVLMVEPYKSELLPHWTFKQPSDANRSSQKLFSMFQDYIEQGDFIGADMARKFIQMGFTRARRYANHAGGRKYVVPASQLDKDDKTPKTKREQIPRLATEDPVKAESARIFKKVLERAQLDQRYRELQAGFEERYKDTPIPVFDEAEK